MDIKSIDYKDWFINQKRLPDKLSVEYKPFYDFHKDICINGAMVNGVFFNPFLYWHLNIWNTEVDTIDEKGRIGQKYMNPYLRDNEWIITEAIEKANQEKKGLAIGGIRRLAKELADYEPVMTETGEKEIGQIKIGDKIYGRDGKLTNVIEVTNQGIKDIYRFTFTDGRTVDCGIDHQWVFYRDKNKIQLSTKQLLKKVLKNKHKRSGWTYRFYLPQIEPVEFPEKVLPIDPYILGALLGDGCTSCGTPTINSIDDEIINIFREKLPDYEINGKEYIYKGNTQLCKHTIVYRGKDKYIIDIHGANPLRRSLISLKLDVDSYSKFIPNEYKYGSTNQRLELLRGLMDTDGSISKVGGIEFAVNNKTLAEDTLYILRSLGITASISHEDLGIITKNITGVDRTFHSQKWRVYIRTKKEIFKLSRKLDRLKEKCKIYNKSALGSIEYIGKSPATCIMVDNEDKLFLTKGFVPTHNSVIEASYIALGATFDQNSQNVISGLNAADIKLITDKLDKGLNFVPEYWRWSRVEDNWKNQVTLGIKTKAGERIPFSYILIRNLDEGNNEEAIAGTKPRRLIIDEGGKGSFLRGLQAAIPGFTTPYGWGCSPIVTFTGGDMTKFQDAKTLMFDVAAFNFLEYNSKEDSKRVHGLFLGHKYRMEAKKESNLGEYLNNPEPALKEIKMLVSDEELATKITDTNIAKSKKAGDRIAYLKEKMYYPKTVDDIFLNENTNIFDIEGAKRQKAKIMALGRTGTPVILFPSETGVGHEFTDKVPISNFPLKPSDDKDAPVVILEFPTPGQIYGLNTAGVDSYRQGKAKYSNSLGTVYIFKRMHDITGENYQDMFVAYYCARPDDKKKWEEQAKLLIQFYNARALCENDELSFIDYMKGQNCSQYLEESPKWIREIVPNSSTSSREFGVSRSADKVIDFLHGCLKRYSEEIVFEEKDKEGNIIRQVTGMSKILDPMLLEEMIQYNEDDNFDRIVAAELALAQAYKMAPIYGKAGGEGNARAKSLLKVNEKPALFGESRGMFNKRKGKLFT